MLRAERPVHAPPFTMVDLLSDTEILPDDSDQPMSQVGEQQNLLVRLNRIEGQIRGIRKMVQDSRSCIEVLQQLAAAEAALNRISLAMFRHHVDHCVGMAISPGDVACRQQLNELVDIFDRFSR
jgi:DNA-binding FrmR family transcriptional regulator